MSPILSSHSPSTLERGFRVSRHSTRTPQCRSVFRRLVAVALLSVTALLLALPFASPAAAHSSGQSYLYLEITEVVNAEMHLPFDDLATYLDIVIDGDDDEIDSDIAAAAPQLEAFARDHFVFSSGGETWDIGEATVGRFQDTEHVLVRFDIDRPAADIPNEIEVQLDPFFDENADRDALFLIFNDWERGFVNNEADPLARFTADERSLLVDIGDRSWTKNFTSSISLGLDHIKTGPDHILFVAVLLLPSVLAWVGRWEPADRFGASLWRVLKIVSMFTVAHSITFTLAGLGIIPLPGPRLVETIIAVSIAAAAAHNLRPIAPQREWLIAFAFGLFHGLGFASLVDDLQVSKSTQLISLLGRNLGIEIGQALVVLIVFPMLFLLRRTRIYEPLFRFGSIALIVISLGWVTERLFDAPDITSQVIDVLIAWPRIFWVILVLTIASAAWWYRERAAGRLLAVVSSTDSDPETVREPVPVG